jgi:hypothetical protein
MTSLGLPRTADQSRESPRGLLPEIELAVTVALLCDIEDAHDVEAPTARRGEAAEAA